MGMYRFESWIVRFDMVFGVNSYVGERIARESGVEYISCFYGAYSKGIVEYYIYRIIHSFF